MESLEAGLPQVGDVIDRYAVVGLVGVGGMATVFRVRHTRLGTDHALKVLHLGSATIRQRLVQEGRVQATLKHPNLVTVTDLVDLEGGSPGVVMELVDGPGLDTLLAEAPPDLDQADHLARGILAGVAEAHRHQVVHRDLKPANILLAPQGGTLVPKITDFGIAKVLQGPEPGTLTRTGLVFGTPQYMAPEQMRNTKDAGPRADVFSLGAILYELVTHRMAFEGEDFVQMMNRVVNGAYTPVREIVADAPDRMVHAIEAALQVDPEDRPPSVVALAERWTHGTAAPTVHFATRNWERPPPPAPPSSTMDRPTTPQTRPSAGLVVAGALGVSSLLVGVALLSLAAAAVWGWPGSEPAEAPQTIADVVAPVDPPAPQGAMPTADPRPIAIPAAAPKPGPAPERVSVAAPAPVVVAPEDDAVAVAEPPPQAEVTPRPLPEAEPEPEPVPEPEPAAEPAPDPEPEPAPAGSESTATLPLAATDPRPSVRKRFIRDLAYRMDARAREVLGYLADNDPDTVLRDLAWSKLVTAYSEEPDNRRVLERFLTRQLTRGPIDRAVTSARLLGDHSMRPESLEPGLKRDGPVRSATLDALNTFAEREPYVDWRLVLDPWIAEFDADDRRRADRVLAH